jgi:cardiolipin synthase
MKKHVLNAIPVIVVLGLILLISYSMGLVGRQPDLPLLGFLTWSFGILYVLSLLFIAGILIVEKGNPTKTLAWLLVIVLLPIVGMVLYNYFGAHFRETGDLGATETDEVTPELTVYYRRRAAETLTESQEELLATIEARQPGAELLRQNARYLRRDPQALLTRRNELRLLNDGPETFAALFAAIETARHHIHLEYYIWTDDDLGQRLKRRLLAKAAAGVEVRIIFDGLGSYRLSSRYLKELRAGGVELSAFRPIWWSLLNRDANLRNHRKIVVVDGQVGFTGGINIDGKYLDDAKNELGHWRDTHLELRGDSVKGLQMTFLADWHFLTGQKIDGPAYFPAVQLDTTHFVHIVSSGPSSEYDGIREAYLNALYWAQDYLYLSTPYLAPGNVLLHAIKSTALRGIDVRLIIPERGDSKVTQAATLSYAEELLRCGVRVFQYRGGFVHNKIFLADDQVAGIGTANLDLRSMDQNLEVNAFSYDPAFIQTVKAMYTQDLAACAELDAGFYDRMGRLQRFWLEVCRLGGPLL